MPATKRKQLANQKIYCEHCKTEIKEEKELSIECDKCGKNFHLKCTKLDKRQYERLLKSNEEEFVCHVCVNADNINVTVREELLLIKAQLIKLDQLTEMQNTMNFMSAKFDEILKSVAENKKKVQILGKENCKLKNEIIDLKNTVKMLNDQRVKNDCLISGINVEDGVSATDAVLNLSKNIGVDIREENIEDAYVIKKRNLSNAKPAIIVVKFNTKMAKNKLMAAKSKIRSTEGTKAVFVNDFLGRESLRLFNYAKTLKSVGYRSIYTSGGKIYAKKSEIGRPRLIKREEDVDNILMEATTNRTTSLRMDQQQPIANDVPYDDTQPRYLLPA